MDSKRGRYVLLIVLRRGAHGCMGSLSAPWVIFDEMVEIHKFISPACPCACPVVSRFRPLLQLAGAPPTKRGSGECCCCCLCRKQDRRQVLIRARARAMPLPQNF